MKSPKTHRRSQPLFHSMILTPLHLSRCFTLIEHFAAPSTKQDVTTCEFRDGIGSFGFNEDEVVGSFV